MASDETIKFVETEFSVDKATNLIGNSHEKSPEYIVAMGKALIAMMRNTNVTKEVLMAALESLKVKFDDIEANPGKDLAITTSVNTALKEATVTITVDGDQKDITLFPSFATDGAIDGLTNALTAAEAEVAKAEVDKAASKPVAGGKIDAVAALLEGEAAVAGASAKVTTSSPAPTPTPTPPAPREVIRNFTTNDTRIGFTINDAGVVVVGTMTEHTDQAPSPFARDPDPDPAEGERGRLMDDDTITSITIGKDAAANADAIRTAIAGFQKAEQTITLVVTRKI